MNTKRKSILQEDLEIIANSNLEFEKFKNKTIFITGATGLVGSQIARAYAYCNYKLKLNMTIILFIRNKEKARSLYGDLLSRGNIEIIEGDVLDCPEKYMNANRTIDYIVHAASITTSKAMISNPVDVINISVNGTKNMLDLAYRHNVKGFIYISSMEMYGQFDRESLKINESDLGYLDILNVRSNYPESKRMCENMCIGYMKQYHVPVYIARLSQTFGAGILQGENRVFAQFARSVMNGQDIVLHTKGLSEGNYCYTRDMVLAIMTILLKGKIGNAYNVVNEETHTSIAGMAKMVAEKIANNKIKVIFDIPEENIYGYANDTKMKLSSAKLQCLGWKPSVNLEEAYRRMISEMRNMPQDGLSRN